MGLNTLWVSMLSHVNYFVMLVPRVGITLIMMLLYSWIIYILLKRLNKVIL